jgi:phage gpG-like protein
MAVAMTINVRGIEAVRERLDRINPKTNSAWVARALVNCALKTQEIAAFEKILPGGGKSAPVPGILTSRSGNLRRQIRVNRSPLPWAIEVGTDLIYGAVHELGKHKRIPNYPARPFLKPGLEKAAKSFDDIFMREWKKEMR